MAFQASTIIQRAYYLANILSAQAEEPPSTSQIETALDILNQILDVFSDSPYFSTFQQEQTFSNITTPEIWIGPDITDTSDATKTVFIDNYYLTIFSANTALNNGGGNQPHYPLTLYSLAAIAKRYYLNTQSITKSIYWTNLYTDTNGLYTKMLLVPSPSEQGASYTLYGIPSYLVIPSETTNILPDFSLYLTYSLAFELAMLYGKESEWVNSPKSMRLAEMRDEIISNTPLDLTVNTTIDAFGRTANWYQFNTPSTP